MRISANVNGERVEIPPLKSLRAGGAGGRDLGLDAGALPPSSYVERRSARVSSSETPRPPS